MVPDNKAELSRLSDPEDTLEEVMVVSGFFWAPRTLRSMKLEIKLRLALLSYCHPNPSYQLTS